MLTIFGTTCNKVINPTDDFYEKTKVKNKKGHEILTMEDKATQIGEDYFGKDYRGFQIQHNGVTVENIIKDRKSLSFLNEHNVKNRTETVLEKALNSHLSKRLSSIFK